MKNPNAPASRLKRYLTMRWSSEDYPGGEPRFQLMLLAKDIAVFVMLPALSVIFFKSCENATNAPKKRKPTGYAETLRGGPSSPQIIVFAGSNSAMGNASPGTPKRSPGTLVRLKLMNLVETYQSAPVHAQVVDGSLGQALLGGTVVGDASADTNFERINITFRVARDARRASIAFPIAARALGLDGTLGLVATKKEGAFTRSVYNAAATVPQESGKKVESLNLQDIVIKALSAGLLQEFSTTSQVERNRSQVLTLQPGVEFFAELTDYFPSAGK